MNDIATAAEIDPPRAALRREQFQFTGTASEYFGIWIVNVLLSIVTLGIYSAWAKVRRLRYFYGNTSLAGATFDYHGRPLQILVGRIVVLVMLIVYNIMLEVLPVVGVILVVLFLIAIPWFISRGLRFSARVTSYRNVRFDFSGGYWGAAKAYILGAFVLYATLGLAAPVASKWSWEYSLSNLRYGDRPVTIDAKLGSYYSYFWLPAAIIYAWSLFVGVVVIYAISRIARDDFPLELMMMHPALLFLIQYVLFFLVAAPVLIAVLVYTVGTRNVAMNATVIDSRHRMVSWISRGRFAWITVTNLLATILTLGLARPWAAVRMAKYMATVTALDVEGQLDDFVSTVKASGSATGSEFMDLEGIDFGV